MEFVLTLGRWLWTRTMQFHIVTHWRFLALWLAALTLWFADVATPRANDAYATVSAGGLVLGKTEAITMVEEDLDISMDRIAVRYVFENRSNKDIRATVAFPMPSVARITEVSPMRIPRNGDRNFVGFTVRVDGKPLEAHLREKAVLNGKDVSEEVRRLGFDLGPMHQLRSGSDTATAQTMGLYDPDFGPTWDYEATYHWEQTFPAGRQVQMEHSYAPIVGSGLGDEAEFCIDRATASAIKRIWKGDRGREHYGSQHVKYILTSAETWAGPIRRFHLTLRKDRPETIVSTCVPGLTKTGPTTFEWSTANYVPAHDLSILFVNHPNHVRPGD